jgi:2-polyprenyl-6-methoxyphenol hydroxylase-like FAD-dependent oxidoreductase
MQTDYDVAIVGYGPVGQTLAILLGQRGWRVGVFEKQPTAYPLPRAVHFDGEVARILQAAGVADDLSQLTEPAHTYEWRNQAGDTLLLLSTSGSRFSGWPEANMFTQPELEGLLDAKVRSLASVEVHRGDEAVGLENAGDGARIALAESGGQRRWVSARYVVGCDGANSFVRQHLGATITDLGFFFDWLIVDLIPHQPRVWHPLNWQLCDPARPTTIVSGGPKRRRWEFMRLPGESVEDLNNEQTAWRLLAPWDMSATNATLERHAVYRFQARWVDTWRNGPLLLAGDAAHQMPPFAGQGMCAGIRDAANLAWKLDLVLAGIASDALLDTYLTERIAQVQQVIGLSIELGKIICVANPAEAAARDAAMTANAKASGPTTPLPMPGITSGLLHDGDPLAGRLFLQAEVRRGDIAGRFDDVVGRGWTLLSTVGDPTASLDPETASFFAEIGGVGGHIGRDAPLQDVTGRYTEWFANHGVAVVLQRPDFHAYGSASTLAGSRQLLSHLRSRLR